MDVSIIIVNWNTRDILKDCLNSVYEQTQGIKFEVIVIDNHSTDGSAEMIKNKFPQVRLIENSANRGFAAANNQGITKAKGRYVLLLNSDTIVLDNAIAKIVSFADNKPDVAVVGCRVLNPDRTVQQTCFMFPSVLNMVLSSSYLYKLFPGSKFFGRERMNWWMRDDIREVDVVTGCFMLVRRAAIEQVGLMDECFFMYCEEADWCYRFFKSGWKMMFTPDAEIIHLGGQSSSKVKVEMLVQLRLSILKFISKHHGWLKHKIACFLTTLFFAFRVPIWLIVSVFGRKSREQAVIKSLAYISGMRQIFFASGDPLSQKGQA
ncbi:MAG: hypothetical protein AMJ43_07425 [Coxiella sp. DG_40]|nr:MAG: hypothetical protein AMJ43_07425 [Coxiella sp. DG_40]